MTYFFYRDNINRVKTVKADSVEVTDGGVLKFYVTRQVEGTKDVIDNEAWQKAFALAAERRYSAAPRLSHYTTQEPCLVPKQFLLKTVSPAGWLSMEYTVPDNATLTPQDATDDEYVATKPQDKV